MTSGGWFFEGVSSSSPLVPAHYFRMVVVFITGSIVMFTVLLRWNGVSKLKPSARNAESQKNKRLITIKHKFMTYHNNSNDKKIIVTLTMNKPLQQVQNYDFEHLGWSRQKTK
jgi:hypothetical protein